MDEIWAEYLECLIDRCGLAKYKKYRKIFEVLHDIDYIYVMERDKNRLSDGLGLRRDFENAIHDRYPHLVDEFHNRRCSVMEMLVALAIRVDTSILCDPMSGEETPYKFFMEMIENLRLDQFKGMHFDAHGVRLIISLWMRRNFKPNGEGSPFPVKNDDRDQRKLETWDQVNSYISENY